MPNGTSKDCRDIHDRKFRYRKNLKEQGERPLTVCLAVQEIQFTLDYQTDDDLPTRDPDTPAHYQSAATEASHPNDASTAPFAPHERPDLRKR
jgi:hypothetical protein